MKSSHKIIVFLFLITGSIQLLANADDKAEYYPQYFIFDKAGKLVVSKAKRPSQKEELYTQIEEFLK